ncbi:MAG: BrnT family toxin [Acidobacteria bacterium]|nr:BrnT family toxin [Acidobacteriota bacterium]
MFFSWEETKNRINQGRHSISFEVAKTAFDDQYAVSFWDREVDGEDRWHLIGRTEETTIVVVVHTTREKDGQEITRIISARRAIQRERALYEAAQRK